MHTIQTLPTPANKTLAVLVLLYILGSSSACGVLCCAVENERLSWELEQVRGLVDTQELAHLRTDLHSLRNQILLMASQEDNAQVTLHLSICSRAEACCCPTSTLHVHGTLPPETQMLWACTHIEQDIKAFANWAANPCACVSLGLHVAGLNPQIHQSNTRCDDNIADGMVLMTVVYMTTCNRWAVRKGSCSTMMLGLFLEHPSAVQRHHLETRDV